MYAKNTWEKYKDQYNEEFDNNEEKTNQYIAKSNLNEAVITGE